MEFGRAYYTYETISFAARAACRYAIVHGNSSATPATKSDITTQVQSASPGLDTTKMTVTPTWTPDQNPGSTVKVQVSYTFDFVSGIMLWNASPITLSASSQMVISQ
jgi:Flp pilus assembly protein TadG